MLGRLFCTCVLGATALTAIALLQGDDPAELVFHWIGNETVNAQSTTDDTPVDLDNTYIPGVARAPHRPTVSSRPAGWPGGPAAVESEPDPRRGSDSRSSRDARVDRLPTMRAQYTQPTRLIPAGPVPTTAIPTSATISAPPVAAQSGAMPQRLISTGATPAAGPRNPTGMASQAGPMPTQPFAAPPPGYAPAPTAPAQPGMPIPQSAMAQPAVPQQTQQPVPQGPPPQQAPAGGAVPPSMSWRSLSGGGPSSMNIQTGSTFEIDAATIIARVGPEIILASDLMGEVNEFLERHKAEIPEWKIDQYRREVMRGRLNPFIDIKLIIQDAKRKIPPEGMPKIEEALSEEFEKEVLPKRIAEAKVQTSYELEQVLKKYGTTLARERKNHIEQSLAKKWMLNQLKLNDEISRDEMLAYYHQHPDEFERRPKVRYEQILLRLDRYPNPQAAQAKLANLGMQLVRGAPFAEVAKAASEEPHAKDGGIHDWTNQGSLKSKVIDQALFALPVGQLSPILQDERAMYIVRVIERIEAGRIPFEETQDNIRRRIREERFKAQSDAYLTKLKSQIQVWTIFDEPAATVPQMTNRPQR